MRQKPRSRSFSVRHEQERSNTEMSFCDILNTCINDEESMDEKMENVRLAQETFDKAIRDASVSFRQLRRLEKLETQTNERLNCGVDIIDKRFDRVMIALNRRREELKRDMESGQKRQLEAVHRCKNELKSLHYQCRAAEMASRRALRSANFDMFLEQRTDFAWRSAIGDATRERTRSEILRMERKYALCVSFPDDAETRLLSTCGSSPILYMTRRRRRIHAARTQQVRFEVLERLPYAAFHPHYLQHRFISSIFCASLHLQNSLMWWRDSAGAQLYFSSLSPGCVIRILPL